MIDPSPDAKRRIVNPLLAAVAASILFFTTSCSGGSGPKVDDIPWPDTPVSAAIAGQDSGEVVAHNDELPRQLASTTKLLTAIVVLEEMPLESGEPGQSITITAEDAVMTGQLKASGGVTAPVGVGDEISQRDLLAGMLVASVNNYAEILVRGTFGSQEAFLDRATEWAKQHDLESLHIADAAGMSLETVGTAKDLVEVGRLALEVPVIAELVSEQRVNVGGTEFENTNLLLNDPDFIGLKTGNNGSMYNLVFARTNAEGATVVGAVLGEKSAGAARESAKQMSEAALAAI